MYWINIKIDPLIIAMLVQWISFSVREVNIVKRHSAYNKSLTSSENVFKCTNLTDSAHPS